MTTQPLSADGSIADSNRPALPEPTGFTLHESPTIGEGLSDGLSTSIGGYEPLRNRFLIETGAVLDVQYADLPTVDTACIGSDVAKGMLSKLSSLIYLEEGNSYTFQHQGSGTLSLVLNGSAISDFIVLCARYPVR